MCPVWLIGRPSNDLKNKMFGGKRKPFPIIQLERQGKIETNSGVFKSLSVIKRNLIPTVFWLYSFGKIMW